MSIHDLIWDRYGKKGSPTFIDGIRSTMATHGISQGRLADRAGIDRSHVSRFFRGHKSPSLETKVMLDEALTQILEEMGIR